MLNRHRVVRFLSLFVCASTLLGLAAGPAAAELTRCFYVNGKLVTCVDYASEAANRGVSP